MEKDGGIGCEAEASSQNHMWQESTASTTSPAGATRGRAAADSIHLGAEKTSWKEVEGQGHDLEDPGFPLI